MDFHDAEPQSVPPNRADGSDRQRHILKLRGASLGDQRKLLINCRFRLRSDTSKCLSIRFRPGTATRKTRALRAALPSSSYSDTGNHALRAQEALP